VKSAEERLRFYASRFNFVEVDATYYSVDMEGAARAWVERTPRGFTFDVKAFRIFTGHQTPPGMLPSDVREALGPLPEKKRNWYWKDIPDSEREALWQHFERSLQPLVDAKKLGAVVFQMPHWMGPRDEVRRHLVEAADRLDRYKLAVEFRNRYWLNDRWRRETFAFMRENGLSFVIVDEPQGFKSSVPLIWEITDPELAVVRLHGRNRETWEKKGLRTASERFNYEYSDRELREFASPVRELSERARDVHVTFNNNYQDNAQRSAQRFKELLAEVGRDAEGTERPRRAG
jgi:uncharacterized protein YecE (DUF72 family)